MSLNIFYSTLNSKTKSILIEKNENIEDLRQKIAIKEEIYDNNFKLYLNGKHLETTEKLRNDCIIRINNVLIGGKGGFGSMLRAIGAQIEKTTNREACRDLSGRRLRDVNEEKRIKEWIANKDKRKQESDRKRKERLQRLASQPKCEFNDIEFERKRSEIPDIVEDALQYGLQQQLQQKQSTSSGITCNKRKTDQQISDNQFKKKKHALWLGIDDIEDSDQSEEESNESEFHKEEEKATEEVNDSINNELTDGVNSSSIDIKVNETKKETLLIENVDKNENDLIVKVNETEEVIEPKLQNSLSVNSNNVVSNEITEQSSDCVKSLEEVIEPLNLMDFESIERLESIGLDPLKKGLMALGMKCGGTLQERAKRLWSVRGLDTKDIPKNLLAFKKKNK